MGVIEKKGKFLIAQRSFKEIQAPGLWSLPGGKVELYKEEPDILEKTLRREIKEEVGIVIKNILYLRSWSFIRVDNLNVVCILFVCQWKSGKAKAIEDSIDVKWISIKQLNKYKLAQGIKKSLKEANKVYKKYYKS